MARKKKGKDKINYELIAAKYRFGIIEQKPEPLNKGGANENLEEYQKQKKRAKKGKIRLIRGKNLFYII